MHHYRAGDDFRVGIGDVPTLAADIAFDCVAIGNAPHKMRAQAGLRHKFFVCHRRNLPHAGRKRQVQKNFVAGLARRWLSRTIGLSKVSRASRAYSFARPGVMREISQIISGLKRRRRGLGWLESPAARGSYMTSKGPRRTNGGFELADAPSHLIRRCQQYYGDLYAREAGAHDLTKQQFTVLAALEHNEGVSQTALVEMTGIDRSTLAEMVRRMLEKDLISRERTEEDARANSVSITAFGRKSLRGARTASDRAERALLDALPAAERARFVKSLAAIAEAASLMEQNGEQRVRRKVRRRTR